MMTLVATVAFFVNGAAYMALWHRISWLRGRGDHPLPLGVPTGLGFFIGGPALIFIFSGLHEEIDDKRVTLLVHVCRVVGGGLIALIVVRAALG